ncbi:hypothetical protein ACQ4PT_011441 [Festuca glaucescens]
MASRSAALCFSAAVATTTSNGGRSSSRSRLLIGCCDSSRKSDLLSSSLAAKVLGAPTTFDAAKLTVQFAGDRRPAFPRAYTLSHCDFTANLTLAVSGTITIDQLRRWRPDDVFVEWKEMTANTSCSGGGEMTLHLHCLVSGRNPLQALAAGFRYYVFSKELPLVLKAVVHGDGAFFADRPELMEAQVWVHFHSASRKYNRIECWGPLWEAAGRNLLDGRLDELESEITKRRGKWNIFNALVSLLL